jgi:hypothetical protein
MFTTITFDFIQQLNIIAHPMVWISTKITIALTFGDWSLVIVLFMLVLDFTKLGLEKKSFILSPLPSKFLLGLVMQEYSNKVIEGRKLKPVQQDV